MNRKTKLSLIRHFKTNRVKKVFSYFYFLFTKYNIVNKSEMKDSEVIFFISHEKIEKNEHLMILDTLFRLTKRQSEKKISKYEVKRVFNTSIIDILKNIIVSNGNILNIIDIQMNTLLDNLNVKNNYDLKKIIVFNDTNPLQNYIVDFCNNINIKTLGLQHGFYPEPNNKFWKRVYLSSNVKYLAAWDKETIKNMELIHIRDKKYYLHAGPISCNLYKKKDELTKKINKIKKVAIYGTGFDQVSNNLYLIELYKYMKKYSDLELLFICHPNFNLWKRFVYSVKFGIKFHQNSLKKINFDHNIILESSVWLELEEKESNYLRLDSFYPNTEKFSLILDLVKEGKNFKKINNNSLRQPFKKDKAVIDTIIKFIEEKKNV